MKNMKKWMLIPAIVGAVAVGSVALAEDSLPSTTKKSENLITLQEAKQVATEKVKNGVVTEIELDKDDDRYHFDIDMEDGKYEYELEVDAYTGKIIKFEKEVNAQTDKQAVKSVGNKKSGTKVMLTKDRAIAIAKQHASGVVTDFELDHDVYEIEMEDGNIEYELEIDAYTGAVLSFERDDD